MRSQPRISGIYGMANADRSATPADFGRIWKLCKGAWKDEGLLVVRPAEMPPELARDVTKWANETYGKGKRG